ncbi:MAG: 3'-5' exonuclease [Bacteroidetes bacterium]|jgi:DNA polymerase III epsilon subunit-like protein|nr:3'-5' exonuclease [Bacteroidota bacterium]
MVVWPGCLIRVAPLLFFDIETTGLRPDRGARITEMALVDRGEVRFAWEGASSAPDEHPVAAQLPPLLQHLQAGVVVGHNVSFDVGFIAYEAERVGYAGPRIWYIDTLALSRRLLPSRGDYRLDGLLAHFDLVPEAPLHTAVVDARATQALFWSLVDRGELETLADAGVRRLDWTTF